MSADVHLSSEAGTKASAVSAWREHEPPGLMSTLGPLLSRREDKGWAYALKMDARHLNQAGAVHGGTITALLDHALSTIAWEHSNRTACVTIQLDTSFLSPARITDLLIARGEVTHGAGSIIFLTGTLHSGPVLVATAQAVMKRLNR